MPGLELASIVTAGHADDARSAYPDAEVLASADDLFAADGNYDVVVVAAPNRHHASLALAAIDAGLHVVVDKPLAADSEEGRRIADAASAAPVVGSVFHNRRWDGDFLTLRRLVADGSLGELHRFESRFERWRPDVDADRWRERADPADAGGVLFDLGPHLIDQALELLGPVRSVYAEVRELRPGAQVDDDFFVALEHHSGARSHLWGTTTAAQLGPRLRALGSKAAYVKWGLDVQEAALRAGASPSDPGFGEEPREAWGLLGTDDSSEPVPTERGRYLEFYEQFERAIRAAGTEEPGGAGTEEPPGAGGEEPAHRGVLPPVPLEAGVETLRVIEAARRSSHERAVVPL